MARPIAHKFVFGIGVLLGALATGCSGSAEPSAQGVVAANDLSLRTQEDKPVSGVFDAEGARPEGFTVRVRPKHGTLKLAGDTFTYTPGADYHGDDRFVYEASGDAGSDEATVTVTIAPVNDVPQLVPADALAAKEDESISGVFKAEDPDEDDKIRFEVVSGPISGSLKLASDGGYTYTPNADWNGSDRFSYRAGDGRAWSKAAEVAVTVVPVNDAPYAASIAVVGDEDTVVTDFFDAGDVEAGDILSYQVVTAPAHGSLTLPEDGMFRYVPNADWNGADTFAYRVSDGSAWSNAATVDITIDPVNDAPSAAAVVYAGNAFYGAAPITVLPPMIWSDIDGDPASYLYRWEVDGVTVPVAAATLPATYVTKNAQIRAVVTPFDGYALGADVAGALIIVKNTPPTAAAMSLTTDEDTALDAAFSGADIDSADTLAYEVVTAPANGALSFPTAGSFRYSPNADWNGADSFAYRVSDGTAWSPAAIVNLTVAPVNDAPWFVMVVNNNQVVDPGASVTLTAFAADKENDALTITWIADGATVATGSSYSVTAPAATYAQSAFTIRVSDGAAHADASGSVRTKGAGVSNVVITPAAVANQWTFTAQTGSYTGAAVDSVWWRIAGTVTATGSSVAWDSPGIAGVYQIELAVTDAAGYTGWFTAATALTSPTEWAGWGNDLQSTGQHLWAESLGGDLLPAPVATTGAVVYQVFVEPDIHMPLALSSQGTLLGQRWPDGFFARRATDGAALWSFDTYTFGPKPTISSSGTAYFGSNNGQLRAFRDTDGFLYWTATPGSGIHREAAIGADGRLYSASEGTNYRALNPANAAAFWTLSVSPDNLSTNAVVGAGGQSYVGAGTKLYSVYADGTTQWTLTFAQALRGVALGGDGTVYAGGLDDKLYAVAPTGAVKWSLNVGQDVNPPKIGPDGTIYVKTTNGNLTAVSPEGVWKWKYDSLGTNPPAIGADGTIYLATYGELVALTSSGTVKWRYTRPGYYFGAPVIDAEGYVYVATSEGYLYKFK